MNNNKKNTQNNNINFPNSNPTAKGIAKEVLAGLQGSKKNPTVDNPVVVPEKEITAAPKKSIFSKIADGALGLLKIAAPAVANTFIPGSGAVVKGVLSTLNDDEWFGKYQGNGASFNELLNVTVESTGTDALRTEVTAAFAEICTTPNVDKGYLDAFMPSVLAYVRSKTNNVLIPEVINYYAAYMNTIQLYMVYYYLKRIEALSLDTPVNIPTLGVAYLPMRPEYINQIKGITDSLESYLKSSVRLPYAITEYLRWRFGTTFLSTNTKKAGMIMYVPHVFVVAPEWDSEGKQLKVTSDQRFSLNSLAKDDNGVTCVTKIANVVNALKNAIAATGRCSADFYTAYEDHQIRFDVEDRHWDEKEFCLRSNYQTTVQQDVYRDTMILLDSRLDMNAAIQAATISTMDTTEVGRRMCPFFIGYEALYYDCNTVTIHLPNLPFQALYNYTDHEDVGYWKFCDGNTANGVHEIDINGGNTHDNCLAIFKALGYTSLQMHLNRGISFTCDSGGAKPHRLWFMNGAPIAFDKARITTEALQSIQRAAILNLTRGDYKRKEQPDIREDAKTVVEAVTSDKVKVD